MNKEKLAPLREEYQKKELTDEFEFLKELIDVKLRVRKDITSDYVLAKLSDKDKEAIIEMTQTAWFSKKIILVHGAKKKRWYMGRKVNLNEEQIKYIKRIADDTFDTFMNRVHMIAVLNRNVDGNYLINVLSKYKEEHMGETDIKSNEADKLKMLKEVLASEENKKK